MAKGTAILAGKCQNLAMDGGWLHVVCGDSAAGSLRASGAVDPSTVRVQHDVLSVGPLLPRHDLPTWRRMRHAFWCEIWPEAPEFAELWEDVVAGADQLPGATAVALWIGGSLSDQLLLPSTDWIARLVGADTVPMAVVRFPGNGLGTRSPEALRRHPAPLPLTADERATLRSLWEGITAPEPGPLLEAIALAEGIASDLKRALGFFLTKYPDVRSGLARWDEELLRYAPGTPAELVGRALRGNGEWLDPVGDRVLHARLRDLADPALPRPALAPRGEDLVLTGFGEDVLAGRKNFVDHNGIDTWVAGVHLDASAGRVWFREGAGLVRAEA